MRVSSQPLERGATQAVVLTTVLIVSLGLSICTSPAAAAACEPHGGFSCGLSAQYSGSWNAEKIETSEKRVVTGKISLTWSEHFDGQYWVLDSVSGSFSCNGVGEYAEGSCRDKNHPTSSSCSGSLSLAGAGAAAFRETQVEHYELAGVGGFGAVPYISHDEPGGPATSPGTWYVGIVPPLRSTLLLPKSLRYEEFIHSSDTEPESPCASSASARTLDSMWDVREGQWAESFGGAGCHYVGGEVGDDWVSFPAGSSHTASDSCSGTGKQGNITGKATLSGSVTFSSPGVGGGGSPGGGKGSPPQYGPEFPAAKQEALRDLREEAIPNSMRYCIPTAVALAGGAAGVLTLGLGSAGGILAVAGSITASTLGPFCSATVKRLVTDYKAYKDPPLASIHVLARPTPAPTAELASCTPYAEPLAAFCNSLRAADSVLLGAASQATAVAVAVEQTVSREHAARGARNRAAVAAQDANLRTLKRDRSAAKGAERRAGAQVARVLGASRVGFRLSRRQSALVIAQAERLARREGVTRANLRSIDRRALKPASANLLADLSRL